MNSGGEKALNIRDSQLQYIARISGGKDGLKMLDVIVTRGLPLDRITTTDVWATDTIRGEHPEMVKFKERADEYIWQKYRIEVEHLCAMRNGEKITYEKLFYHIPKRKSELKQRSQNKALHLYTDGVTDRSIKGFPVSFSKKGTWCQKLKTRFLDGPTPRGAKNIVEYLGIAADEPKRFGQLNERKRAPLVEFGIEEDLCGLFCQYEGILAPSYETSCRDGCWMCHNQGVNQLRQLRKNYPELWAMLLKWDTDSPVNFKPDGHTVHDFDRRFQMEDEGLLFPDDKVFRWSMLDAGDLNYRLF